MANAAKGASLNPADMLVGGAVPDGRYTITSARAVEFDYGGTQPAVPALCIVLNDGATEYTQNYSAGKLEFLVPSEDGSEFVHPNGEEAKITKNSNLGAFLTAVLAAGFPVAELSSRVTCFVGADIDIENKAQQKRPGLKDQVEGKTIPLPVKYHGRAKGGKVARPTPPAASTAGKSQARTTSAPANNGDLDAEAIMRVQEALGNAKDNTLSRVKLQVMVVQTALKTKDANAQEYRKLIGNAEWLTENAAVGGWTFADDTVTLA